MNSRGGYLCRALHTEAMRDTDQALNYVREVSVGRRLLVSRVRLPIDFLEDS